MKKIYILCPANSVTGGPELLHQLNEKLNLLGYNSKMKYIGEKEGISPIPDRYKIYSPEYESRIEDSKDNYIIVPEIFTNELKKYKNINKIIWWLSVDNYFVPRKSIGYKIKSIFGLRDFDYRSNNVIHLAQSVYAVEFLKSKGIEKEKIYYLSDYLNDKFIEEAHGNVNKKKRNCVLYNPKKGYEFTNKIIKSNNNIEWIPLINLTVEEMCNLMQTSKVYIDFGNHPGKDRIPREAAISGCCIITSLNGSARYREDVPILDEFKFEDKDKNVIDIVNKINSIFINYNKENSKFEIYRKIIMSEKDKFENDVKLVFEKLIR